MAWSGLNFLVLSFQGGLMDAVPATVLLVDDDKAVRGLVRRALREEGYQILEAGDGMEALESARMHTGPIDLLLTDVIMPGLNGFSLATQLVQIRPNVAVLYMSGYI